MDKSVGKALESALKEKDVPTATLKSKGRYLFSNQNRRTIFSALTLTPCIGIAEISRKCQIKENTAVWHIKHLINSGYVVERRGGKRKIFFPEGLVPSEDVQFFKMLNRPSCDSMLSMVFRYPGSTQQELSKITNINHQAISKTMAAVESEGFISSVSEGNHVRYYPTTLLSTKAENFYTNSKRFTDFLLKKIDDDGEYPDIIKKSIDRIILELGQRTEDMLWKSGLTPT